MTQRNIDAMDAIVNKLAEGKKFSDALKTVYSKRKVRVPYNDVNLGAHVTSLGMSMRTTNALLRAKLNTVGDVISFCNKEKLTDLSSMGKASGVEVLETILNYCWDNMSEDSKEQFLINTVELNECHLIA